jgi:glycosyltransferase involved in cell wall biosynthesis
MGRDEAGGTRQRSGSAKVSVVVPALNEEHNVGWVLQAMPPVVDQVVLVDGRSRDNTVAEARSVVPDVMVVEQNAPGKGAALRAGFAASTGDYVVMIDADGSMDPGEIPLFVAALDAGYDLVKGSRTLPGGGSHDFTPIRELGNHALCELVDVLFMVPFSDLCYGYCAFRRDCLDALALTATGFEVETEIAVHAVKAGLRIAEVPSIELPRMTGASNLHAWRDGRRVLRVLVREKISRRRPPVVDGLARDALVADLDPHLWQQTDRTRRVGV